jgi:hypothetical protein
MRRWHRNVVQAVAYLALPLCVVRLFVSRSRVELVQLLLQKPDFLSAEEPNHSDAIRITYYEIARELGSRRCARVPG